jgi:hypothetical protein
MDSPRSRTSRPGVSGGVEAFVVEVGFVDDLGEFPQSRVVPIVVAQDRLEAAVLPLMAELHGAHVEGGGVGGHGK